MIDAISRKPLAGIEVEAAAGFASTGMRSITDRDGRYRIPGLPSKGSLLGEGSLVLTALPGAEDPHFAQRLSVGELAPGTVKRLVFELVHGVWLEGNVIDKVTRKPVYAALEYYPTLNNPAVSGAPALEVTRRDDALLGPTAFSRPDGGFRIRVLPGSGVVLARALRGSYPHLRESSGFSPNVEKVQRMSMELHRSHAISLVHIAEKDKPAKVSIELEPEPPVVGRLLDSEGHPVIGAWMYGADAVWAKKPLESERFSVQGISGVGRTDLMFVSREQRLGACVRVEQGMGKPLEVRMQPTGIVKGRLVDPEANPRPNVQVHVLYRTDPKFLLTQSIPGLPPEPETDEQGRFTVENIVAGVPIRFQLVSEKNGNLSIGFLYPKDSFEWTLEPGETQDWADVRERPKTESR